MENENCPKYRIETLEDFLKVPEDRLADCLEEFTSFLNMARTLKTAVEEYGIEDCFKIAAFLWLDDGKKEKTISLKRGDK